MLLATTRMFCTSSLSGCGALQDAPQAREHALQVWRRQRRGRALTSMWTSSLVLSCPIDDEAAAAARRRRRAPPNPSINQVAWTMDDNKVLPSCWDISPTYRITLQS